MTRNNFSTFTTFILGAACAAALIPTPASACTDCDGVDGAHTAEASDVAEPHASPEQRTQLLKGPALTQTATFAIEGMTCGGCSKGVERGLAREDGVLVASVKYEDKQAVVKYDPAKTTHKHLASVITRDGEYKATLAKGGLSAEVVVSVDGMTCGGCAKNVKAALGKVPGYKSATVLLKEKAAVIRYDPTKVAPNALVRAVSDAGYEAEVRTSARASDKGPKSGTRKKS